MTGPASDDDADLTRLIRAARDGDSEAHEALFAIVYARLRDTAHSARRGWDRDSTLNTTSLVHEFFLKFNRASTVNCEDRRHFFNLAVRMMRQILLSGASQKQAQKRGGGAPMADYREDLGIDVRSPEELLLVDQLLTQLEEADATMARVFEYRRFGKMTTADTAEALDISVSTVKRYLKRAETWLYRAMHLPA